MQHYIKQNFAKNTQYATKFFNSEVKMYIDKLTLLKFKPTINYYLFFYKIFAYLSKKVLNY